MDAHWQPQASFAVIQHRASLLRQIRQFFFEHNVLEVETPLLSASTVTDVHIESISATCAAVTSKSSKYYLQTSPEFHMKRLLAAGSGSIYQITKAFRNGEIGKQHNPEFSMLEWYRVGFEHHQLMDEIDSLLQVVIKSKPAQKVTYSALFKQFCGFDPVAISAEQLQQYANKQGIIIDASLDKTDWLQLIMSDCIEPNLGIEKPQFVYDYPAEQAALAKIKNGVAERFELYIGGKEIANGFNELTDAQQQQQRFAQDLVQRTQRGLEPVSMDYRLLAALQHGLPQCAGVALGLDRLLMQYLQLDTINQALSFPIALA